MSKQIFIGLLSFSRSLASMDNVFNFTTCTSLNNQPHMIRPTFIDLNSKEYHQRMRYYLFVVNLGRYNGRCNAFNDPSDKLCIQNKTEGQNLN